MSTSRRPHLRNTCFNIKYNFATTWNQKVCKRNLSAFNFKYSLLLFHSIFGSYGIKITGEEYLWDCIKENASNKGISYISRENENMCSGFCWICCFGFVLEKGQNKVTLTLRSRNWWDWHCCSFPRDDYSIIFSTDELHLIIQSPNGP